MKRREEIEEIQRRRGMTEEERQEDDRRLDAARPEQPKKGKYTFLQKYYHRVSCRLSRDYDVCILLYRVRSSKMLLLVAKKRFIYVTLIKLLGEEDRNGTRRDIWIVDVYCSENTSGNTWMFHF